MKVKDRFRISEFQNPRSVSYRLYGRLPDGGVVRENFKTYQEAVARRQELEIELLNQPALVMRPTRLSADQLADAEAASRKLDGTGHTLLEVVDFFQRNWRPDLVQKTVKEAYDQFIAEKHSQNLRARSLQDLERRVGKLVRAYGGKLVSEITVQDIKTLIYTGERSAQTIINDRRCLATFYGWTLRHDLCSANVALKVEAPMIERGEPEILSLAEVNALLNAALAYEGGKLVPYFTLSLFAGLRSAEVERLDWSQIDLKNKVIIVQGKHAKMRSRRVIELTTNAVLWLMPHVGKPVCGTDFRRDFGKVRMLAGFQGGISKEANEKLKPWPQNALRHAAISFWLAKYKDEGIAAARFGNSPNAIHRFYRGLVMPADAEVFWSVTPDNLGADNIQEIRAKAA